MLDPSLGTSQPLTIGIVGAGVMGRGIAQLAALAGSTVLLADARPGATEEARQFCAGLIKRKAEKAELTAAEARAAIDRIIPTNAGPQTGYAAFAPCQIVIEAVVERMDIKTALIADLESVITDTCIIASNTSSLSITAIAATARHPGRVAGFHFFNPAPLMKIVEVVGGLRTEPWVLDALTDLARRMGHHPARAADTPGFIVNHLGRAYSTEALRIVSEGITSFADLDRIMTQAAGFRMGPFELFDLTGLDVSHPATESIYHQYYEDPRFRPVALSQQRLAAGVLGRKTGGGFYDYIDGKIQRPPEAPPPALQPRPIWVSPAHPGNADILKTALNIAGIGFEDAATPSTEAVILLTPSGDDCTTAALAENLDPSRCLAVDCLLGLDKRRTLMRNPATRPDIQLAAHAALAHGNNNVTLINDSPGFIAPRILATIVNLGTDIAQQRIASTGDIDRAVELGLGYPKGPLKFGNAIGPARVLAILDSLFRFYQDPRYRPSPWLKRRALLGLDLVTPD